MVLESPEFFVSKTVGTLLVCITIRKHSTSQPYYTQSQKKQGTILLFIFASLNIPLHLTNVATLPCEIRSKSQQLKLIVEKYLSSGDTII